jgi:exonuclease III
MNQPINNIRLLNLNVRSIRNKFIERNNIIRNILIEEEKGTPYHIIGLNETWINDPIFLNKWIKESEIAKSHTIISDIDTNTEIDTKDFYGKGTILLVRKNLKKYIQQIFKFPGRLTAAHFKIGNENILIANIYMPSGPQNQGSAEYNKLSKTITNMISKIPKDTKILLTGDWNAVPNPSLDRWTTTLDNESKEMSKSF